MSSLLNYCAKLTYRAVFSGAPSETVVVHDSFPSRQQTAAHREDESETIRLDKYHSFPLVLNSSETWSIEMKFSC